MEYSVWSILETRACAKPHKSIDALKSSLKREWRKIPQDSNSISNKRAKYCSPTMVTLEIIGYKFVTELNSHPVH